MKTKLLTAAVAMAVVSAFAASASTIMVSDGSFEGPALAAGAYEYGVQVGAQHSSDGQDAVAPGVVFGVGSGVQSNGSAWGFANAPDGSQTAFVQSYDNTSGTLTLMVTGLQSGASYDLSFFDANRAGYAVNPVTVYVNDSGTAGGANAGVFTPTSTSWSQVETSFKADGGTEYITFYTAAYGGDADIGLDNVQVAVPEPAVWAMMLIGFGLSGAGIRMFRRRETLVAA